MELHAPASRVAALEAQLAHAGSDLRPAVLAELAWHLRQRDSLRALQLVDEAESSAAKARRPYAGSRLRLALVRCEVAALFYRTAEAETWLASARDEQANDPDGPVDTLLAEVHVAKARGDRERVFDAAAQAVRASSLRGDPLRAAFTRAWLVYEGAFTNADQVVTPDLEASRRHVAVDALLSAVDAIRLLRREPARAVDLLLHASEQAQRVGLVRDAVVATINAGTTLRGLGEHEKAAACFDVAESVARQTGWPGLLGTCRTQLGAFLSARGRLEEAHHLLVEAHRALTPTPPGVNRANACSELALVRLRLDRPVEAIEPMAEAIRMLRDCDVADNLALSLTDHATILSAANRVPEALEAIAEAQGLIQSHGLQALEVNVNQALAAIHRRHPLPAPPDMREPTPALHFAEQAIREGRRYPGWQPSASELTALAEDWAAAGDPARAYGHARAAIATMHDEMSLLTRPSPSLVPLSTAGAAPPVDEVGLWHPAFPPLPPSAASLFTPKELQVLRLLARAYTNKEIAISLDVSDQTVKWHLKQVFAKLDVGSRKQAVSRARALGVVAFDA